ncbi:MAG: YjgN family protein [Burkholderiales bacterium]
MDYPDSDKPTSSLPESQDAPLAESAAPTDPLAPRSALERHQFRFTGDAREYFRIWIVNLFLTLVTLGIYSAWAKVRKKRYFYGHTWLANSNFDYHGQPIAILKGRLIAAAFFSSYYLASHYIPRFGTAMLLALMLLAPWFIVRSMAFNARYSSYRNVRFGFRAEYFDALKAIWPLLLVPIITLFLPKLDPEDMKTSPTTPYRECRMCSSLTAPNT